MEKPRDGWSGPEPGERLSAVPRWLAVLMLAVFLAAGGCSAWLIVSGDFGADATGTPTSTEPPS